MCGGVPNPAIGIPGIPGIPGNPTIEGEVGKPELAPQVPIEGEPTILPPPPPTLIIESRCMFRLDRDLTELKRASPALGSSASHSAGASLRLREGRDAAMVLVRRSAALIVAYAAVASELVRARPATRISDMD